MNDTEQQPARQTGITTNQMQSAPHGAVFVWVNSRLDYPAALARHIGRSDLAIVGPSWLDRSCIGRRPIAVVVDHSALLTAGQRRGLGIIHMRNGAGLDRYDHSLPSVKPSADG